MGFGVSRDGGWSSGQANRARGALMPRWLVYVEEDYYPWAQVVEAADAPGAIVAACSDLSYKIERDTAIAVAPLEHVIFAGQHKAVKWLAERWSTSPVVRDLSLPILRAIPVPEEILLPAAPGEGHRGVGGIASYGTFPAPEDST
jgi:hypothetical protein